MDTKRRGADGWLLQTVPLSCAVLAVCEDGEATHEREREREREPADVDEARDAELPPVLTGMPGGSPCQCDDSPVGVRRGPGSGSTSSWIVPKAFSSRVSMPGGATVARGRWALSRGRSGSGSVGPALRLSKTTRHAGRTEYQGALSDFIVEQKVGAACPQPFAFGAGCAPHLARIA